MDGKVKKAIITISNLRIPLSFGHLQYNHVEMHEDERNYAFTYVFEDIDGVRLMQKKFTEHY